MPFLSPGKDCERQGHLHLPPTSRKAITVRESTAYDRIMIAFQKAHGQKNQAVRFVLCKSLKTRVLCGRRFPRLISRGLIEACSDCTVANPCAGFPRLISRGLIEANPAIHHFTIPVPISATDQSRPH
jgi:hypothetical protein